MSPIRLLIIISPINYEDNGCRHNATHTDKLHSIGLRTRNSWKTYLWPTGFEPEAHWKLSNSFPILFVTSATRDFWVAPKIWLILLHESEVVQSYDHYWALIRITLLKLDSRTWHSRKDLLYNYTSHPPGIDWLKKSRMPNFIIFFDF